MFAFVGKKIEISENFLSELKRFKEKEKIVEIRSKDKS